VSVHRDMDDRPPAGVQEAAEYWFVRLQSADCAPAERRAFEHWRQQDARHGDAYAATEALWAQLGLAVDDPDIDALPEAVVRPAVSRVVDLRVSARGPSAVRGPRRGLRRAGAALAMAATLTGVWIGWPYLQQRLQPQVQLHQTAVAEIRQVRLEDGTRLVLDADSRVAVHYRAGRRDVEVERGTAYFEVQPDATRPFVVAAPLGTATVLGTRFQVTRVQDGMDVVLSEGSLRLGYPDSERRADTRLLHPGQRAALSAEHRQWHTAAADTLVETSWRDGRVIFDATPLSQALDRMNRYAYRSLHIADPALGGMRISGVFRTDDPEAFLLALQHSYGLQARPAAGGGLELHRPLR